MPVEPAQQEGNLACNWLCTKLPSLPPAAAVGECVFGSHTDIYTRSCANHTSTCPQDTALRQRHRNTQHMWRSESWDPLCFTQNESNAGEIELSAPGVQQLREEELLLLLDAYRRWEALLLQMKSTKGVTLITSVRTLKMCLTDCHDLRMDWLINRQTNR